MFIMGGDGFSIYKYVIDIHLQYILFHLFLLL